MNLAGLMLTNTNGPWSPAYTEFRSNKKVVFFSPSDGVPTFPSVRYRERGIARESGDGPFFLAKKTPEPYYCDDYVVLPPNTTVRLSTSRPNADDYIGWCGASANCDLLVSTSARFDPLWGHYVGVWFGRLDHSLASQHKYCAGMNGNGLTILCDSSAQAHGIARDIRYCIAEGTRNGCMSDYRSPWIVGLNRYASSVSYDVVPPKGDLSAFTFIHGEYGYWCSKVYDYPYYAGLMRQVLFYDAYYDAVAKLPALQQNTIANVLQIISSIKSLMAGFDGKFFSNGKKLTQEAWLAWRYEYNTTKSDIVELAELTERLCTLQDACKPIRTYATAHSPDGQTYHACVVVDPAQFLPTNIKDSIKTFNVRLNATNIWDMIPYSFIVDWFLPIGEICGTIDEWLQSWDWCISEVWYSYSSHSTETGEEIYLRWKGNPPALPRSWHSKSASSRTLCFRAADTLSLFF